MRQPENENSLKTAWYYNKRAFAFWWKTAPLIFVTTILSTLVNAAAPYVTIYFTARLINEIGAQARADVMFRLAFITLLSSCLLSLLGLALKQRLHTDTRFLLYP